MSVQLLTKTEQAGYTWGASEPQLSGVMPSAVTSSARASCCLKYTTNDAFPQQDAP